jgi:hypothetical protein
MFFFFIFVLKIGTYTAEAVMDIHNIYIVGFCNILITNVEFNEHHRR